MQEAEFQQRFQAAFRFGKWEKREASYADEFDNEINVSWLIKRNAFWRNDTLYPCRRNSNKIESFHWMTVHLCINQLGCQGESRPEASGSASILAQHLKAPTVSDVLIANRVVRFSSTENGEHVQSAHLIMVADDGIRQGIHFKASTLMWRSAFFANCNTHTKEQSVNHTRGPFNPNPRLVSGACSCQQPDESSCLL